MTRRRRVPDRRQGHRMARVNELLREIVAEGIERLDDERLRSVTITGVDTDAELQTATVYFTCFDRPDDDPVVAEGLRDARPKLQRSIGDQARLRRTPVLRFAVDTVARGAERIDDILRGLDVDDGGG